MAAKDQIRAESIFIRDHLPESVRKAECKKLNQKLMSWISETDAYHFYVYAPLGSEADIRETVLFLQDNGRKTAFPKVKGKDMFFVEVQDMDSELKQGCFHVMEPVIDRPVDWKDAIVLTPGVAFDRSGNRIGYGKGYYDRYFAGHRYRCLIGITYRELLYDKGKITADKYDRKMDLVCTPVEITEIH